MQRVVVRVWLPDRPGALGQVASRIGAVRGDVLGIEILEAGGGRVVDELVVALPSADLIDLLIAEIGTVDGVSVEHVRPIDGDRIDPDLVALTVAAELGEADPADRIDVVCNGLARVADADWAAVVRDGRVLCRVGEPPDEPWLLAFLDGSQHVVGREHAPSDLVWAHLTRSRIAIAAGRAERPVHVRERTRVALLGRIADPLLA